MEQMILKVLSFNVAVPTANTFLEHYIHEANFNNPRHELLSMVSGTYPSLFSEQFAP